MALRYATTLTLLKVAHAALDFSACPQLNTAVATELAITRGLPTFECANLDVPLDYTDEASDSLELDLFRVRATDEPVLGSVLVNFGGPGGVGVTNLAAFGDQLQEIVGRQWNLVTWDPRGTGKTIPFKCTPPSGIVPTSNTKRDTDSLIGTNVTEGFLEWGWEEAGRIADACFEQADETATLIGTAFTARDVMQIVDALDDGDLNFYGWSYGTALGSYLAAMFPDRIARMVLDGNINPHEYQSGTYAAGPTDTDAALEGFMSTCFEAQDDCSLYTVVQPNTTEDLFTTINAALAPLARQANTSRQSWLSWVNTKAPVISLLYFPRQWPMLADTIAALLTGDSSAASAPAVGDASGALEPYDEAVNALFGIRSGDAIYQTNSSADYLPIIADTANVSDGFSDVFYTSLWVSARWRLPAKERYYGDFRETTQNPILYVNGQFDPVTPLVSAYNGSAGFEGSRVLAHSGYGHGLLASPSRCASRYVQAYFADASLPDNGTVCEPDDTLLEVFRDNLTPAPSTGNSSSGGSSGNSTGGVPQPTGNVGPSPTSDIPFPEQTGNGAGKASGAGLAAVASVGMLVSMMAAWL